jgi:hypothetical protein
VLEIVYEKGTDVVMKALRELELLSPMDMSADKVKVICEHKQEKKNGITVSYTDSLTEKSRSTLSAYDRLAALQSGKIKKEVV